MDEREKRKGNELIVTGAGVGVAGFVGAAVLGVTCPACVVVAPAFVGAGLFKRWKASRTGEVRAAAAKAAAEAETTVEPG